MPQRCWLKRGGILLTLLILWVVAGHLKAEAQGVDDLAVLRAEVSRLQDQGKYTDAIPIAERYVALARQKYGEEHTEFATAIAWLASVYRAQGRYAEAEPLYKRSLAIYEKAFGLEHAWIGTSLVSLAAVYVYQGR